MTEKSIVPMSEPEQSEDAFTAFLLSLKKDADILESASVLIEEAILRPTSTDYPEDRQCFRVEKTYFNQQLLDAVQNIFISVYAIHQNKTLIRAINGVKVPRVTFTAEMRLQVVPKKGSRMRVRISMEVGDIFPLALFSGLPVDVRQVPLFKIQSIEHNAVKLMPVYNPQTTLPDR